MLNSYQSQQSRFHLATQILKQHNVQVLINAGLKGQCLTAGLANQADDFDIAQFYRALKLIGQHGYTVTTKKLKATGALITQISM